MTMTQLTRPAAQRRGPGYEVRNGPSADSAEVLIYEPIGGWMGISANDFAKDLKAITAPTIHVRLNSPGGDVFDGVAIYNALRTHDARVIVHVDGLAASIASIIALAGDEVRIAENAFFMIHDPWAFSIGNAAEMRKMADTLDKIGGSLVDTYMKKSGASRKTVETWMHEETWFTAQEAIDEGFADALDTGAPAEDAVAAAARFDLSAYRRTPDALTAMIAAAAEDASSADVPTKRTIERALRDAGCSRTHAKAVAALADKALEGRALAQRDAGDDGASSTAAVLAAVDSIIAVLK
jgi:ATP-dependent Clp protease protease subunit